MSAVPDPCETAYDVTWRSLFGLPTGNNSTRVVTNSKKFTSAIECLTLINAPTAGDRYSPAFVRN